MISKRIYKVNRAGLAALFLGMGLFLSATLCYGQQEWVSLFDGETLSGWKAGDSQTSFYVEDGAIVHEGERAHLYYVGPVGNHSFKNFEFKALVYTYPKANSGLYFHSRFQEKGFPNYGYEVQINNSHTDPIRTGSLYNVVDLADFYAQDETWFELYIKVKDQRVQVRVDGVLVVDYTELPDRKRLVRKKDHFGRYLDRGTFAIQAHDPASKSRYKDLQVRILD